MKKLGNLQFDETMMSEEELQKLTGGVTKGGCIVDIQFPIVRPFYAIGLPNDKVYAVYSIQPPKADLV